MTDAPLPITHLLYLHGFRSSPASFKAQLLGQHMAQHHPDVLWHAPALPPSPKAAMAMLLAQVANWPVPRMAVVGSSLGGFYASVIAERLGCRAVLLNPAVFPARDLAAHLGPQQVWHDPETTFVFRAEDVAALAEMQPQRITQADRYSVIIAKGDEVLDWREMHQRYQGARVLLLEGGDHALSDFAQHLPFVMQGLGSGALYPTRVASPRSAATMRAER
ncbi:MAG: hypothetical protein RL297_1143 [Pseudomonadota bacterium]